MGSQIATSLQLTQESRPLAETFIGQVFAELDSIEPIGDQICKKVKNGDP
jgi:hypothetical protein